MPNVPTGYRILSVAHDYDCLGCQVLVAACIEDLIEAGTTATQAVISYPDFEGVWHSASVFHEPVPGISAEQAESEFPS